MNWRSPRFRLFLLVVFLVLIIGVGAAIVYTRFVTPIRVSVPPLPTPSPARTTYTNAQFSYSIRYPTQWYLTTSSDNSSVHVLLVHDLGAPEAIAFEITCFANPNQLDAQQVWQQQQPPSGGETAVGPLTFSSGTPAYVATGQGQTSYTLYTLTHNQVACQITTHQTDPLNAQIILATVNSFRWQ